MSRAKQILESEAKTYPQIIINLGVIINKLPKDIKDNAKKGWVSWSEFEDWTNTIMDILEDEYEFETQLRVLIEKE